MTLLQLTSFLRPDFASALVDRGAEVDLHSACALGEVDSIRHITANNPKALELQIDTYLPIQFALRHPDALRALLESGDDPNRRIRKLAWFDWEDPAAEQNLSDWRPIHMIALGRRNEPHRESAAVLKEFGANLATPGSPFGETAIHLSAIYNRAPLIRWLVEKGVDVDERTAERNATASTAGLFDPTPFAPFDFHRQTPLMAALGEGQTLAIETLLELGADVNCSDSAGFTPLHYAAGAFWKEDPTHVQSLLDRGADRNARDVSGRRPIDLATRKSYSSIETLLKSQP